MIFGLVCSAMAALFHVFIFYLESFAWVKPKTRSLFGLSERQAIATREMAFNQGFYNLFLSLSVFAGLIAVVSNQALIGYTLVFVGVMSMAAASLVLWLFSPDKRRAAVKQGTLPFLGIICLVVGLAIG